MGQGCSVELLRQPSGFEIRESFETGGNRQRLSSESWLQEGIQEEGTVWIFPYKVDVHRSLGAGGLPSLLPQAPGVREQQSVTIWLPFGDLWLFSAQLQHIREGRVSFGLVFL